MSFPSLSLSLGGADGTRRSTTRLRMSRRELHEETLGEKGATPWIHPDEAKRLHRLDRQRRTYESTQRARQAALAVDSGTVTRLSISTRTSPRLGPLGVPAFHPSSLLARSLPVGSVVTLNGRVGKVIVPPRLLPGLSGLFVALQLYRAHGVGKRPAFDFNTVIMQRKLSNSGEEIAVPAIDASMPSSMSPLHSSRSTTTTSSSSSPLSPRSTQLVGAENLAYVASSLPYDVDLNNLSRAQREASRLVLSVAATHPLLASASSSSSSNIRLDHVIFVRVDEEQLSVDEECLSPLLPTLPLPSAPRQNVVEPAASFSTLTLPISSSAETSAMHTPNSPDGYSTARSYDEANKNMDEAKEQHSALPTSRQPQSPVLPPIDTLSPCSATSVHLSSPSAPPSPSPSYTLSKYLCTFNHDRTRQAAADDDIVMDRGSVLNDWCKPND